jgi:hypothetical protein
MIGKQTSARAQHTMRFLHAARRSQKSEPRTIVLGRAAAVLPCDAQRRVVMLVTFRGAYFVRREAQDHIEARARLVDWGTCHRSRGATSPQSSRL